MNAFAGALQGKFHITSGGQHFLYRANIRYGGIALAAFALSLSILNSVASAQSPIFQKGDGIITGFSGVAVPTTPFPPGVNPIDEILIDPEGASAQILRLAPQSPLQGQVLTPSVFKIKAKDVGQVFGVALDDAPVKNIYLGATSAFGLQILVRDNDGKPERAKVGGPRATFMPGQFGKDGGPGTIYKVDGKTGAVSIFATIPGNSGPGIGQLTFDPATHQFFASDLDTGLIHTIDSSGKLGATFDHGTAGRTAAGLAAIADDGATINLTLSSFNSEDVTTWGFTPKARRVGGLAVHAARLYYAVAEGPQVWSVSLSSSGAFGSDAKLEIDAQTLGSPNAVASITFDSSGVIYLAQRGDTRGSYDYSTFAEPNNATVARFRRDPANPNAWMALPEFYAVGADPDYRSAAGGVDIGLGVAASGAPSGQCNMLWSTGDALKKLGTGANAGIIHGLQGNDVNAVRPADTPPVQTNVIDYDQMFADPTALGHIGAIAVWRNCDGAPALTAQLPYVPGAESGGGYYPGPNYPTDYETGSHLTLHKVADSGACLKGAKSFCHYTVTVTNDGPDPYFGTIVISDQVPTPFDYGVLVADAGADPWKCQGNGSNAMQCTLTGATLNVGDKKTFKVHVRIDDAPKAPCDVHNTASLISPAGNSSSASASFPDGSCKQTPHLVVKKAPGGICVGSGPWSCYYDVTVTNDGKAEYTGPIVIEESTFNTGAAITDVSGVFDCGTPAQTVTCKPKVTKPLAVNGTLTMKAKVQVPVAGTNPPKCSIQNAATLKSPAGNTSTATDQLPPDSKCSDTHISKKFDDCKLAGDTVTCNFTVTVRNTLLLGFYSGEIKFTDTVQNFDPAMTVTMPGSPWSCVKGTAEKISCTSQKVLGPFSKTTAQGSVSIDQSTLKKNGCRLYNLAELPSGQGSSATIDVKVGICGPLPGAISNLKLTKTPDPACVSVGGDKFNCSFKIDIENTGPGVYAGGQVTVRESYQPVAATLDAVGMNMVGGTFASAPFPFADMPLDIGALKKGEHYSGTVVLTLPKESCVVFNAAEITVPAGRTPFNGDDSDDSGTSGMLVPTQACAMLTNHVVTKKKNDSPRCTPGFNFRAQDRTCAPAIVTVSNTAPAQQCPPGFNLDQNSRCAPGIVTVPTTTTPTQVEAAARSA